MAIAINIKRLPLIRGILMAVAINTGHINGKSALIWGILMAAAINMGRINGSRHL